MLRHFCLALFVVTATASLLAQSKEDARLEAAGLAMEEVLNVPDGIPQDLLDKPSAPSSCPP
ncbi:MAG TPA: hypothetical protein VGQ37_24320 [Vicinamibacterales bacterium]|jgi:hypothetical protein|nr:hypothetical protein [Vicinamibacterales bacterium]